MRWLGHGLRRAGLGARRNARGLPSRGKVGSLCTVYSRRDEGDDEEME